MAWVIVGLGNPGEEYVSTRHNTGRIAVEAFAKKVAADDFRENKKANAHVASARVGRTPVALILPDTFMNRSGNAVAKFVKSVKAAEHLVVVYDDLDLPLGSMKLSFDRGSGGHKGLESIIRSIKTKKFVRVRIGVSPSTASGKLRKPSGEKAVVDFILAKFKPSEAEALKRTAKRAAGALGAIITEGREKAMNEFNQ